MPFFDLPLDKLKTYKAPKSKPADFDKFWKRTLKEHASHAPEPELKQLTDSIYKTIDVYDVTFKGYDSHPIKGWFYKPKNSDAKLPCVVSYNGYGSGRFHPITHMWHACAGIAHLVMDTRNQGAGHTGDPGGSHGPSVSGYMTRGIESPDHYFYRRVFTDAVLAIRAAASLDAVDPKRIGITGISQGGGITIAAAALTDHPIKAMIADVPFLCDYKRAVAIVGTLPYGELTKYFTIHRDKIDTVFKTLAYFDGVNMATRVKVPAMFSVGLMDDICPPSTVFAAYNNLKSKKKTINIYDYNKHEGGQDQQVQAKIEFLLKHL